MQAVIAGRGRQGQARSPGRYLYPYTSSMNGLGECTVWRCCGVLCFGLASAAALFGIMLTVFGSTDFFRTNELNQAFLVVGIALLLLACALTGVGFVFNRRAPQRLSVTSRIPTREEMT